MTFPPYKIIVLPIYRRHWLFHGYIDGSLETIKEVDWRKGKTIADKFQLWSNSLSNRAYAFALKRWQELQSAKEGSFRNWTYRLAQAVLSREDPFETLLKTVPSLSDLDRVEIVYPKGVLKESVVRRRLRLLAQKNKGIHQYRSFIWGVLTVPFLPLLVTPLPNLPLYYCVYRLHGNYTAWSGAQTLGAVFGHQDAVQLQKTRDALNYFKQQGVVFPKKSWASRLLRGDKRYLDIISNIKSRVAKYYGEKPVQQHHDLLPKLTACEFLAQYVKSYKPNKPLDDEAAQAISKHFNSPDLFENVARVRRRGTGAFFPHNSFTK